MCNHRWRKQHEESILGGSFPIGYRCTLCNKFVRMDQLTPAGLGGIVTTEDELMGPHGVRSRTTSGQPYSKQIVHEDGRLEIVP